jgi:hypothetical protein
MPTGEMLMETVEYLVALVLPESRKVLAIRDLDGYRFPAVDIATWSRPAEQLLQAIKARWGVSGIVLDFLQSLDRPQACVVVEVIVPNSECELQPIEVSELYVSALDEQWREQLISALAGGRRSGGAFSQIGWIDEAILWLESETGRKVSSKHTIAQYNAGDGFSLVRFRTQDGRDYWLKATGVPNAHEPEITRVLSNLCGGYLPEFISFRSEWNAWLMSGEATALSEWPERPFQLFTLLESAVESMAQLQTRTRGHGSALLNAGAFDQGMQFFLRRSPEVFDYLQESMSLQTSTKTHKLGKARLLEMRGILDQTCERMESLGIGESIVHGDLNTGNILIGIGHCQFIDWSEAYFGNPLITLQHLLLLNKLENTEVRNFINLLLRRRYREVWVTSCDPEAFDGGFVYMPILAVASTLYGRGDWLTSGQRDDPRRQSYARSLARYMDREANEPVLREALCL